MSNKVSNVYPVTWLISWKRVSQLILIQMPYRINVSRTRTRSTHFKRKELQWGGAFKKRQLQWGGAFKKNRYGQRLSFWLLCQWCNNVGPTKPVIMQFAGSTTIGVCSMHPQNLVFLTRYHTIEPYTDFLGTQYLLSMKLDGLKLPWIWPWELIMKGCLFSSMQVVTDGSVNFLFWGHFGPQRKDSIFSDSTYSIIWARLNPHVAVLL